MNILKAKDFFQLFFIGKRRHLPGLVPTAAIKNIVPRRCFAILLKMPGGVDLVTKGCMPWRPQVFET